MRRKLSIGVGLATAFIALGILYARAQDQHKHDDQHAPTTTQSDAHDDHDDHAHEVKLTPEAVQRYGIRVETVTAQAVQPVFTVPARVEFNAEQMAHVGTAVRGRVTEMKARLGDAVKKGDELVVLESTDLAEAQSEYIQRRTAQAVATSAVAPLKQSSERASGLYDQNQGIALAEVQKRAAELKAAEGAVTTAQAAETAAMNRLTLMGMSDAQIRQLEEGGKLDPRTVIRSPIDGTVVEREITLGELVTPETEALLVIANMQTLWVLADVPEARLPQIVTGASAQVQVPALPEKTFEGKVSYISSALDPHTRTAAVRIEVENDGVPNATNRVGVPGSLRPGMFASAQLVGTAGDDSRVLVVREGAVQTVEGRPSVFVPVKGEENTFAPRPVKAGPPVNGVIPIHAGLSEGDQVVVRGAFILKAELGKSEAGHGH